MVKKTTMTETVKTGGSFREGFAQRSDLCSVKKTGNTQRIKVFFDVINQIASLTTADWNVHVGVEIF